MATLSGEPVPGRAFAYQYDTIGNRTSAVQNEETFGYVANLLNQYTNVTSPGVAQVLGTAATNATVTADFVQAERLAEHYLVKVPLDNSSGLVYDTIAVTGVVNNSEQACRALARAPVGWEACSLLLTTPTAWLRISRYTTATAMSWP